MTQYLKVALPLPFAKTFDYLSLSKTDKLLAPGMRLKVPFKTREVIGMLMDISEVSDVPESRLKPILDIIDDAPILDQRILQFLTWSSDYYHHPIGEVIFTALPGRFRKGKALDELSMKLISKQEVEMPHQLNDEQQKAVDYVTQQLGQFDVAVLEGVTGSGKTEVYLHIIQQVLASNQQALILVPEIGLTPQTLRRFENRFNVPVFSFHSGMTEKHRAQVWQRAKSGEAKIIIGTRSAVFLPLATPGIIIIDEVHDGSFKQQEGFRYSARDLAVKRASLDNIPVVMGTATPSLELLHHVKQEKYKHLTLLTRAGSAVLPKMSVIDIRGETLQEGLSKLLLTKIQYHLEKEEQVMIFLNRRGYAPVIICHECGWTASCRHCDSKLTFHIENRLLHCHHCGTARREISECPSCHQRTLFPLGIGTERVESTLKTLFPKTQVIRIDRDSTRTKGALESMLDEARCGKNQILIGTQMLAKGHHFPNVTMVAMLDIDGGLFSADFRSVERMAQLLIQVAGRAGRENKVGEVVIQTRNPEHPVLTKLLQEGYAAFSDSIYEERKLANLPPFSHLALLKAESRKPDMATQFLDELRKIMISKKITHIHLLGPIPSPMEKKAGWYRSQLLFQSNLRKNLHEFLNLLCEELEKSKLAKKLRWNLDVDPQEMF